MDVGEGKDLEFIHDKALTVGAVESYVLDVKDEFVEDYVLPALQAHAYYEQNILWFQRLVVQLLLKIG